MQRKGGKSHHSATSKSMCIQREGKALNVGWLQKNHNEAQKSLNDQRPRRGKRAARPREEVIHHKESG